MNRLTVVQLEEELDLGSRNFRVVVVLVKNGETKDQAWRRHVQKNPVDRRRITKIFHFPLQEIS